MIGGMSEMGTLVESRLAEVGSVGSTATRKMVCHTSLSKDQRIRPAAWDLRNPGRSP
jgi:hypothetical protein